MPKFTFTVDEVYSCEMEVIAEDQDQAEKYLMEHLLEEECEADELVTVTVPPELTYQLQEKQTIH